jgi:hypothetical protein
MARTNEHRCGKCTWQGTGSTECESYTQPERASQTVPYEEPGDMP